METKEWIIWRGSEWHREEGVSYTEKRTSCIGKRECRKRKSWVCVEKDSFEQKLCLG